MKYLRFLVVACVLGATAAACSGERSVIAPGTPQFDGGHTFGGGNSLASTDTSTAAAASSDTTANDGTAERGGGYTFGSGN